MDVIEKKIKILLTKKKIIFSKFNFISSDASERKYFTFSNKNKKNILMYDKDQGNLKKFLKILHLLKKIVSVPILVKNLSKENVLVLEDFGKNKYGKIINKNNREKLYKIAISSMIKLQEENFKNIPIYTTEMFLKESNLFFEWYVPYFNKSKHLNKKKKFNILFKSHLKKLEKLTYVPVHRDFHIDNLFYLPKRKKHWRCGLIDFQDAVLGPCVYDLVSLTQDARINVPKNLEILLVNFYKNRMKRVDLEFFTFCYKLVGIQRHLKVLGIFCRLSIRDKKHYYIKHLPRVRRLLLSNLKDDAFKDLFLLLKPIFTNE